MANKPMKPYKAWAITDTHGRLIENNSETPILRAKQNNPCDWLDDGERFIRVRILDAAAVERAIAAIRRVSDLGVEGTADCIAAIRGLGGKP